MIAGHSSHFKYRDERYVMRDLSTADVVESYVGWLNDAGNRTNLWIPESEVITIESQQEYVRQINASEDRIIIGLFNGEGKLVGTAGWHHMDNGHKHPSIGILIGNRAYRGIGLGGVWVWINTHILMSNFAVAKVVAGTLATNKPSLHSFLKSGYRIEGTLRGEIYKEGVGWCDLMMLGCLPGELKKPEDLALSEVGYS